MGKKQFIDRKNARHFEVVHRSQRDPLAGDGEASSRVLREVVPLNVAKKENKEERRLAVQEESQEDLERRVGQAALYGVYFDDTQYDYTQHLRPIGENPDAVFLAAPKKQEKTKHTGIQFVDDDDKASVTSRREKKVSFDLPQDALPSEYELSTGLMNQSALPEDLQGLQPDMDPELREVLEALDDEEYVEEDAIDEDFIKLLDEPGEPVEEYEDYSDDEDTTGWANIRRYKGASYDSDSDSDSDSDDRRTIGSAFTMSSSVMFRNDKLTLLDEQFDQIEKEYESDSSECEFNEEGEKVVREDLEGILDEFLEKYELVGKKMVPKLAGDSEEKLETVRKAFLDVSLEERSQLGSISSKEVREVSLLPSREEREREMWDCESILSTYSNLENHPALIRERSKPKIRFDKKGFPIVDSPKLDEKHEEEEEEEEEREEDGSPEKINKGVPRSKKETLEEKKARKAAIKEERKNRRSEKKMSKSIHKEQQSLRQKVLSQRAKSLATLHLD